MELVRNSPALAPLRGKDPLSEWVSRFARRDPDRADRYRHAIALFLGTEPPKGRRPDWVEATYVAAKSPATQKSYRFAIAEFFEFLAALRGRVVPPHEVTRKDAFDYAEWLANRGRGDRRWNFGLEAEKLKDGDTDDDLAIYEAILRLGSDARLSTIARSLPAKLRRDHPRGLDQVTTSVVDEKWLGGRLRALIMAAVIERSPKIAELRRDDPRAGLDAADPIDPDLFVYRRVELRPCSRATIEQRLTALSSFWQVMQKGENAGPKALLEYDVFEDALKRARRGVSEEKRASSLEKRPTPTLIRQLIAAADGPRLVDKRNVALLWFLLLTGGRVTEVLNLRRGEPSSEHDRKTWPGWIEAKSDPPVVVFIGKGNKRRRVALPNYAYRALVSFWQALAARADGAGPEEPAYRYKLLLEEPDAPLLPPITLWGVNRVEEDSPHGSWSYRRSMRRPAVSMLLCRLARKAGVSEKDRRRIHPHGFRHASAEGMAKGGVPLEEIKQKLGHRSVTTTEQYLPDEQDVVQRSGQEEILEWLAAGTKRLGEPEAEKPPPGPREIVTTYAEGVEDELPMAAEPIPSHTMPEGPSPPPVRYPVRQLGEGLVAIGADASFSSPSTVSYDELARGMKPRDLVWSGKPQARWIEEHYPELPLRFGIGKESLLLWWNHAAPAPWPVLSPAQAYPELEAEAGLLGKLEVIYDRWSTTRPSSTLALAQWLYFLGHLTVGLERRLHGAYSWVSFNAVGRVGDDLRAHDEDWLAEWFEKNAHTFTVAQSRFKAIPTPERGEPTEEYWARVREDIGLAGAVPSVPSLPEWFWEADPVHTIAERSAAEWDAFVRWLTSLTGGSPEREAERDEQLDFLERAEDAKRERARGLLAELFHFVDELGAPSTPEADRARIRQSMDALRKALRAEGVEAPKAAPATPEAREQRIATILEKSFPSKRPRPAPNVFGDSRLFRPDSLSIDRKSRTISHTAEFREAFAREHGGLDSECVMRRVARALWERVKPWEDPTSAAAEARRLTSREERRELFITQLAHLAYVVPCPEDVEQRMVDEGYRAPTPAEITRYVNERIRDVVAGADDDIASDIVASYYEHMPVPDDPRIAARLAHLRQERREWERKGRPSPDAGEPTKKAEKRKSRIRKGLAKNAARDLPHPLRLVAAAFWPV